MWIEMEEIIRTFRFKTQEIRHRFRKKLTIVDKVQSVHWGTSPGRFRRTIAKRIGISQRRHTSPNLMRTPQLKNSCYISGQKQAITTHFQDQEWAQEMSLKVKEGNKSPQRVLKIIWFRQEEVIVYKRRLGQSQLKIRRINTFRLVNHKHLLFQFLYQKMKEIFIVAWCVKVKTMTFTIHQQWWTTPAKPSPQ